MTDTLLDSLRTQALDESEPLAGLLRKCLMLGAETGSESLRQWARYELNGYDEDAEIPTYRQLPLPPLSADTISGVHLARNIQYNPLQLPNEARECFDKDLLLRQPLEELEELASQNHIYLSNANTACAQALWNAELDSYFQQVIRLSFILSGSCLTGILGQIRTQLVDVIADLTADTPLTELPSKQKVDAAVVQHIGIQYNTTIETSTGPVAIGNEAMAASEGFRVDDALRLLDEVREAAQTVDDQASKAELLGVLNDLNSEVQADVPDTGAVVKKAGRLKTLATNVGSTALNGLVAEAVKVLTNLAMSGVFG